MYPAWQSCFDAHVYEGRVIQIVLMKSAEEPISEGTVGVSVLAERCKKANGKAEFWVRTGPHWGGGGGHLMEILVSIFYSALMIKHDSLHSVSSIAAVITLWNCIIQTLMN